MLRIWKLYIVIMTHGRAFTASHSELMKLSDKAFPNRGLNQRIELETWSKKFQ